MDTAYDLGQAQHTHGYLFAPVRQLLGSLPRGRIFEVGCGNGAMAAELAALGYDIVATDPSERGIRAARLAHPQGKFEIANVYDDLSRFGQFPIVMSLEVIEHCPLSKPFAKAVFGLVAPGGVAIISTPFHGYLKNLALAVTGKMEAHLDPLWDEGHIKFFTEAKLRTLLLEAGFSTVEFQRVGRIAPLAKSMIAIARKG